MKHIVMTCFLGILLIFGRATLAYEIDTHEKISEAATNGCVLKTDSDVLLRMGLQLPIDNDQQKFPNSDGRLRNILNLIKDGARFEDNFPRSLNHFFDPIKNKGLFGETSPDWALEDKGQISGALGFGKQEFSYSDGRQFFFNALTKSTQAERDKNFGKTFQTLGQVIHHIQDMAQPQHTRNDQHLDLGLTTGQTIGFCVVSPTICATYFAIKNPSLYESYTNDVRGKLPTDFSLVGYDLSDPKFLKTFNQPRKFWETPDGKGLAQYTNSNFVSAGTNFDKPGLFPSPIFDPNSKINLDIKQLLPGTSITGTLFFYGSAVQDKFLGTSINNPMTSTDSIFSADLTKYAPFKQAIFTLNRFNFNAAHALLIPRAVGYSAGLINYFFRGKMQISLPPERVYSVTDASTPSGFSKVKLVLSNQSPTGEDMTGGQVVAVAKFHTNTCYKSDLSGEIGLPANSYSTCRSSAEQIILSAANPLTLAAGASSAPLTFVFSSPIPLSATDLYLQVVYRGHLGQELDAVAVTTLDIAEPTTFDITNMTDYFLLNGLFYKIPTPYNQTTVPSQVDPALFAYIDVNANGIYNPGIDNNLSRRSLSYQFAFGGGTALGSMTVTPSGFARFAVLVNNANGPNTVLKLTKQTYGYTEAIPIAPNINQQDAVSGLPTYSPPDLSRGHYVYQSSPDHGFYPTIVPIPPTLDVLLNLIPQTISINFP